VSRPNLAVLSDFGIDDIFSNRKKIRVGTPFGPSELMLQVKFEDLELIYLQRREVEEEIPTQRYNYRANIWGLNKLGVERIISLNYFRAISKKYHIGDIVTPNNLIDFTKESVQTYNEKLLIDPIDLNEPFCSELKKILAKTPRPSSTRIWKDGIVACLGVPRFETQSERKMFTILGANLINVGISPEIFLSRELRMCYMPAGIIWSKSPVLIKNDDKKPNGIEKALVVLKKILKHNFKRIPKRRSCVCHLSE
jgi:5'-methylthioadenosine phosphorylase